MKKTRMQEFFPIKTYTNPERFFGKALYIFKVSLYNKNELFLNIRKSWKDLDGQFRFLIL